MPIKQKKIVFAFRHPGNEQSLFFRMWKLMTLEEPLARQDPDLYEGLEKVRREVDRYQEQMRRQQVHIDEIKRLCHVPVR